MDALIVFIVHVKHELHELHEKSLLNSFCIISNAG